MYYRLIATRKKEKKTQSEIAEKLFIHRTTYGLKEAGKIDFTLREAKVLSNYFQVSITELFEEV